MQKGEHSKATRKRKPRHTLDRHHPSKTAREESSSKPSENPKRPKPKRGGRH